MDTSTPTKPPTNSDQAPDTMTLRELALAYQVSKQAIAQRIKRLPPDAVTLLQTAKGKITLIDRQAVIKAWGEPPTTKELDSKPTSPAEGAEDAETAEDEALPAQPENAPESAQSAEIEALRRNIAQLADELDGTRQERDEAIKASDLLQSQLHTVRQELDEAKKELYKLSSEKDRLQFEMDGMSAAVDIHDRERETLTATVETLKAQLTEKDRQISELHQLQLAALRTALPAPKQGILSRIFGGRKKQPDEYHTIT